MTALSPRARPKKPTTYNPMRTRAKPEVWANKAEFDQIYAKYLPQAEKLKAVADTGDLAATKAQLEEMNKVCTECHDKFRYDEDE